MKILILIEINLFICILNLERNIKIGLTLLVEFVFRSLMCCWINYISNRITYFSRTPLKDHQRQKNFSGLSGGDKEKIACSAKGIFLSSRRRRVCSLWQKPLWVQRSTDIQNIESWVFRYWFLWWICLWYYTLWLGLLLTLILK